MIIVLRLKLLTVNNILTFRQRLRQMVEVFFIRAVDGTTWQLGHVEDDAIRDIYGHFDASVVDHHDAYTRGAFRGSAAIYPENGASPPQKNWAAWGYDFRASNVVPTANENRVLNIGATPAIYLGV